ncbi:hypothetical protein SLA2020_293190 [Shorea laevis]
MIIPCVALKTGLKNLQTEELSSSKKASKGNLKNWSVAAGEKKGGIGGGDKLQDLQTKERRVRSAPIRWDLIKHRGPKGRSAQLDLCSSSPVVAFILLAIDNRIGA